MLMCWNTELAQHAELVEAVPALYHFTLLRETEDSNAGDRNPLACGRDAPELACVGDAQRPACHHLVPLSDHVLDDVFDIREAVRYSMTNFLTSSGQRSRAVPSDWWERYLSAKTSSAMSSFSSFQTSSM